MLNFNKESATHTSLALVQAWGVGVFVGVSSLRHSIVDCALCTCGACYFSRLMGVCVCCIVNCCGPSAWVEPQTLGTGAQESRTACNDWKCCNCCCCCCPSACPGECASQQPWELLEPQLLELELLLQFELDSISRNKVPMRWRFSFQWVGRHFVLCSVVLCARTWAWRYDSRSIAETPLRMGFAEFRWKYSRRGLELRDATKRGCSMLLLLSSP